MAGVSCAFGAMYWAAVTYAPHSLLPLLGIPMEQATLQSDITEASSIGIAVGLQRVFLVAFASGCIALAAAWYPRQDDGRRLQSGIGCSLCAASLVGISTLAVWTTSGDSQHGAWLAEHKRHELAPADALKKLTGVVEIEPGRSLRLNIEMHLELPARLHLREEALALSLNPGLRVRELRVDGQPREFEHAMGVLTFIMPERPGKQTVISLSAAGRPDSRYGSPSSLPSDTSFWGRPPLLALGSENAVFDSRYVALMPDVHWLPAFGEGPSYFELDLTVEVPAGWLVAAPGRREALAPKGDETGACQFRFRPPTPVAEVGLFASRFESRQVEAAGVSLEALFAPMHRRNFALFGDVSDELAARASELLDDAADLGLPYPYDALTLVEVPRTLRVYRGGWRMGSVQALPGILLLREGGFPTARFEFAIRWLGYRLGYSAGSVSQFSDAELPMAKLELLEIYFGNDVTGGNPFSGIARQLFTLHTSASADAAALDFLCEALALRLLTDGHAYFSGYALSTSEGLLSGSYGIFQNLLENAESVSGAVFAAETGQPAVWERLSSAPLAELGRGDPSVALRALILKADAASRIAVAKFGRERIARLLALLRSRHRGSTFSEGDFKAALEDAALQDARELVDHYLHETALPGFMASPVEAWRLADSPEGARATKLWCMFATASPQKATFAYATRSRESGPGSTRAI